MVVASPPPPITLNAQGPDFAWLASNQGVKWAPPVGEPFVANRTPNRTAAHVDTQIGVSPKAGQVPAVTKRPIFGTRALSHRELDAFGAGLVARELDRLRATDIRWDYLNSIPTGISGSDIDHLVVGPGGIFTIHAKLHDNARVWVGGDAIRVNGFRQPYIRQSRLAAQRAAEVLTSATMISIRVQGLVVPVGAASFTVKEQPRDITVVDRPMIVAFLRSQPPYLDRVTVARIVGFARLSSTWQ